MGTQQGNGFYRFKIGEFTAASISDGFLLFESPKNLLAPEVDDIDFQSFMAARFLPTQFAYTHINALFVDTGQSKVLIDNGSGPYLGSSAGHLPNHLHNLGVNPEEIDTVVLSHAHADHVFGTLAPDGTQVFPNARYVIGEKEWAFWTKPQVQLGHHIPANIRQFMIEGAQRHLRGIKDRVEFVRPGDDVLPGITVVEAFGHSPGMLAMNVASGSESLLFVADALHHFAISVQRPEWRIGFDNDPAAGAATRERILHRVVAEKSLVLASHFPFPGLGQIAKRGQSRAWEPAVWEW